MDREYWENYYAQEKNLIFKPSNFAKYVFENFLKENDEIVELGCGSGRDTRYFSENKINVVAFDQCFNLIKHFNSFKDERIKFECADFTKLPYIGKFDGIYSRFIFHTIEENEEDNVLKWAKENLKPEGRIYIEARSTKNELFKKGIAVENSLNCYIYDNHKRRFLDKEKFCNKLIKYGFVIIEALEDKNFAPNLNENQTFMRVIAQNKD